MKDDRHPLTRLMDDEDKWNEVMQAAAALTNMAGEIQRDRFALDRAKLDKVSALDVQQSALDVLAVAVQGLADANAYMAERGDIGHRLRRGRDDAEASAAMELMELTTFARQCGYEGTTVDELLAFTSHAVEHDVRFYPGEDSVDTTDLRRAAKLADLLGIVYDDAVDLRQKIDRLPGLDKPPQRHELPNGEKTNSTMDALLAWYTHALTGDHAAAEAKGKARQEAAAKQGPGEANAAIDALDATRDAEGSDDA